MIKNNTKSVKISKLFDNDHFFTSRLCSYVSRNKRQNVLIADTDTSAYEKKCICLAQHDAMKQHYQHRRIYLDASNLRFVFNGE